MTDRELLNYALNTLIVHQDLTRPLQITGDCIEKLQDALAQPEPVQVRPAEFIATASIGVGADVIGMPMIWAEWPTPESSTVKWSIPVDPNNFGEPITFMGQYAGEGKVVSASFGLPKGAFEFAPYAGKGEASKIKHSLEPMPGQKPTACGYDETVGMCTNNPCCEQTPVAHLWECIGRWSAYLASNREKANLAPPTWLVDAVKAATVQPEPELTFDVDGEQLTVQQMANLELYKFQEATGYTFADEIFKLEPKFCKDCGKGLLGKEHIHTCSPQVKRQWVGLTAEDIFEITERHTKEGGVCDGWIVAVEVQQKLKEKNT